MSLPLQWNSQVCIVPWHSLRNTFRKFQLKCLFECRWRIKKRYKTIATFRNLQAVLLSTACIDGEFPLTAIYSESHSFTMRVVDLRPHEWQTVGNVIKLRRAQLYANVQQWQLLMGIKTVRYNSQVPTPSSNQQQWGLVTSKVSKAQYKQILGQRDRFWC